MYGTIENLVVSYLFFLAKPTTVSSHVSILTNSVDSPSVFEYEVGFEKLFESNHEELLDFPIKFAEPLPDWFKGSLVRNGLGLFEKGPRTFVHAFDGFAKMASWKFVGNNTALFSTKFINSRFYKASKRADDIAPYLLFQSVSPPFSIMEKVQCMYNGLDNMNVNIYDFFNPKKNRIEYAALSDFWLAYKMNITDLSTIQRVTPKIKKGRSRVSSGSFSGGLAFLDLLSSAHPLPEPGRKNNRITFLSSVAVLPWQNSMMNLIRVKSLKRRRIIAQWPVSRIPYMHSFSVTETKAILLASPFYVNVMCMARKAEPFSCLDWEPNSPTTLYVIELKTGKMTQITMPCIFTMHHINAYDVDNSTIILDVSSYPSPEFVHKLELNILRDQKKRNSFNAHAKVKRIHIDLLNKKAYELHVDSNPDLPGLASLLDMPVINENYRSKKYCYVYGLVLKTDNKTTSKIAIVKKDLCNGESGDRAWHVPGHYPVEPWFVPTPGGTREDDGLILVPVLDGRKQLSYLAVLDGRTLQLVNSAYMPMYLPYSLHGRFFQDVF